MYQSLIYGGIRVGETACDDFSVMMAAYQRNAYQSREPYWFNRHYYGPVVLLR